MKSALTQNDLKGSVLFSALGDIRDHSYDKINVSTEYAKPGGFLMVLESSSFSELLSFKWHLEAEVFCREL